jgi:hypothetical protein
MPRNKNITQFQYINKQMCSHAICLLDHDFENNVWRFETRKWAAYLVFDIYVLTYKTNV